MATTIKSGLQDTASVLSNRLKVDMLEPIQMLDTNLSQFSTILDHPDLRGDTLSSYIKEWLEDRLMPRTFSLGASAASADTVLTTGSGEGLYVKKGDIFRIISTGEAVRATADGTSTSVTVARAVGGVAAASAASGTSNNCVIIGHATPQGSSLPTMLITQQTRSYNYGLEIWL